MLGEKNTRLFEGLRSYSDPIQNEFRLSPLAFVAGGKGFKNLRFFSQALGTLSKPSNVCTSSDASHTLNGF